MGSLFSSAKLDEPKKCDYNQRRKLRRRETDEQQNSGGNLPENTAGGGDSNRSPSPDAQGWETEHHGCILPRLEDAAEGKTVVVFQAHTNACPGSRAGLGFEKLSIDPMAELLSKGKEGHGGMAYKKTPDLAVSYLHSLPRRCRASMCFQPLDKLSDAVVPTAVIFLVNARPAVRIGYTGQL